MDDLKDSFYRRLAHRHDLPVGRITQLTVDQAEGRLVSALAQPDTSTPLPRASVRFAVVGKPEPAGSKKAVPLGRQGRWGVVDDNPKADRYKKVVAAAAAEAMTGRAPFEGPVAVTFMFVLDRPAGHWRKDGTLSAEGVRRLMHTVRPDALKLARAVEDGMTGVVYADDAQIVEERITKRYQHTRTERAGVIVEVRAL